MTATPLVIAHRGASGERPENTLSAYELAVEQRADMIEIDLHRTLDAATVVTHDEELSGLGGEGEIAERTLDEVRRLDAGDGQRVPTLDEVLDQFGSRIRFNLEIKRATNGLYQGIEADALAALRSRDLMSQTLFSSFFDGVLGRLRELDSVVRTALLISRRFPDGAVERALGLGAEAINPEAALVDRALVHAAHEADLAVYVFTVDDPGEMRRLLDLGVDGLFTNYPARMRSVVDSPQG